MTKTAHDLRMLVLHRNFKEKCMKSFKTEDIPPLQESTSGMVEVDGSRHQTVTECRLGLRFLIELQKNTIESQKKTIESQNKTIELQKKTIESQNKTIELQKKTIESQKKTIESQKKTIKSQKKTVKWQKKLTEILLTRDSTILLFVFVAGVTSSMFIINKHIMK